MIKFLERQVQINMVPNASTEPHQQGLAVCIPGTLCRYIPKGSQAGKPEQFLSFPSVKQW